MTMHICEICYKTFKTKQHLNQHVSKKKKCEPHLETNINLGHNIDFSLGKINKLRHEKIRNTIISQHVFNNEAPIYTPNGSPSASSTTTVSTTPILDNTKHNDEYHNISSNCSDTSEINTAQNLSLTNLLEFVNTHKKILEEKNKLESTLIILKKHIDKLSKENVHLKNKINIVNNFVFNYKTKDFLSNDKNSDDTILL